MAEVMLKSMSVLSSSVYQADLEQVVSRIDTEKLRQSRILVTGASGLIGSAVVDVLLTCNRKKNAGIQVYGAGRDVQKLRHRFPDAENDGFVPVSYDATAPGSFDFEADYIIHAASNASPDKYVSEPVDTLLANILGVHNLMTYAGTCPLRKFVYVSSSEVYGKLNHGHPMKEEEAGTVDFMLLRSSYPVGKRAAENLCVAYANQHGMDISIVRPGHIYGPTAQDSDGRVSSAFVRKAVCGEDIVMKSAGTQIRSYCHCLDCASAILAVMTGGRTATAYNISNRNSVITIRQMATIITECTGVKLIMELPSNAESAAFNPMDNSSLDASRLEALGWEGLFDARVGFDHTVKVLQELNG